MGNPLIKTVVEATGLPEDPVQRELNQLIAQHGKNPDELTIEDLREIVADYLHSVMLECCEEYSA